jgi:uncharacterized membrane protein YagU involved in acid resistance
MERKIMSNEAYFAKGFSLGLAIGLIIFLFICGIFFPIMLSQNTGNEICYNLSNSKGSEALSTIDGKLICNTPTFDSTSNIIIKPNSER